MARLGRKRIPVIDLFAGPGGLAEGFAAYEREASAPAFRIALSVEKDPYAHATLELRAFFRQFPKGDAPAAYYEFVKGKLAREDLFGRFEGQAKEAKKEAWCAELGALDRDELNQRIRNAIGGSDEWVLVGGPPCQAYSLVGRSRNKGIEGYVPERDKRQTLYVEYLQILADHAPPVFIMENVKGLLSARLNGGGLFSRIREDLHSPCEALRRERRSVGSGRQVRYAIHSLVETDTLSDDFSSGEGFVVRSECFGVPQSRHRVVLLGVREDLDVGGETRLQRTGKAVTASMVLSSLPHLRSHISRISDDAGEWKAAVREASGARWLQELKRTGGESVAAAISDTLEHLRAPRAGSGAEFLEIDYPRIGYRADWFLDTRLGGVLNHSARSHMKSDLHRYLFAACYAKVVGRSPDLDLFPRALLPDHENVSRATRGNLFSDRFRVQLRDRPSSTIISHISKDGHYFIHYDPGQCRSLTVREAARLQTFPDNYFFSGARTAQYVQVGNAVPPLLARSIAAVVAGVLSR